MTPRPTFYGGGYPSKYGNWEVVGPPLGTGGQGKVFRVRTPARVAEREKSLLEIRLATTSPAGKSDILAEGIWSYVRPELSSELGALKVFNIPPKGETLSPLPGSEDYEAIERLKNEITVLGEKRHGLPELLDSNVDERWIVIELFPEGSLERHLSKYKGNPALALRAFRSIVKTVALLHKDNYVHRDIKPANVFVRNEDELVLGDFGIVFLAREDVRLTKTDEKVGPRDYMPQWADLGERLEEVQPCFDVYMLGKLLWCMIAGRLKLPREWHRQPKFDLATMFPNSEHMHRVNSILDKCLVEESSRCLLSAQELLGFVDAALEEIERGAALLDRNGHLSLPCRVCGKGIYQSHPFQGSARLPFNDERQVPINPIFIRVFICNVCGNYQFFAPGFPDEAVKRNWKELYPAKD